MFEKNNDCGKKTVVAIGKFDGVHTGHRKLLDTASKLASDAGFISVCLIVAPTGGKNLLESSQRDEYIKKTGIDHIYIQELSKDFMSMSSEDFVGEYLIKKLNCAHVVVGYNFRFAKDRSADAGDLEALCTKHNIGCTVIPEVRCTIDGESISVSSSNIRSLLQSGRVDDAAVLLGRSYFLQGRVVRGRQIGRTIDFPTANIKTEDYSIIPQNGVYATYTYIDGVRYLSVTNIGDNPTVNTNGNITIESHIFNFSSGIYGMDISIEFLKKIRGEVKFADASELKEQISKDKNFVIKKYK